MEEVKLSDRDQKSVRDKNSADVRLMALWQFEKKRKGAVIDLEDGNGDSSPDGTERERSTATACNERKAMNP